MAAIYLKTFGAFWHTDSTAQLIHTSSAHVFLYATQICEIRCLYVSGLPQKPDRRATGTAHLVFVVQSHIWKSRESLYTNRFKLRCKCASYKSCEVTFRFHWEHANIG